jgi:hypothetical protein
MNTVTTKNEYPDTIAKIEFFFRDPDLDEDPNNNSQLYLLRRDINRCLCQNRVCKNTEKILWPATLSIFSGIDLLATYYNNLQYKIDSHNEKKFKRFILDYFYLEDELINALYRFRCAIIHNYGLVATNKGEVYRFDFNYLETDKELIKKLGTRYYYVSLYILDIKFRKAVDSLKQHLLDEKNLPIYIDSIDQLSNYYGEIIYYSETSGSSCSGGSPISYHSTK